MRNTELNEVKESFMNTFRHLASSIAGLLASSLLGTLPTNANETTPAAPEAEIPSCHMEVRRVPVWPHGPRARGALQTPRYETRTHLVCDDEKAASKPVRDRQRTSPR